MVKNEREPVCVMGCNGFDEKVCNAIQTSPVSSPGTPPDTYPDKFAHQDPMYGEVEVRRYQESDGEWKEFCDSLVADEALDEIAEDWDNWRKEPRDDDDGPVDHPDYPESEYFGDESDSDLAEMAHLSMYN